MWNTDGSFLYSSGQPGTIKQGMEPVGRLCPHYKQYMKISKVRPAQSELYHRPSPKTILFSLAGDLLPMPSPPTDYCINNTNRNDCYNNDVNSRSCVKQYHIFSSCACGDNIILILMYISGKPVFLKQCD